MMIIFRADNGRSGAEDREKVSMFTVMCPTLLHCVYKRGFLFIIGN